MQRAGPVVSYRRTQHVVCLRHVQYFRGAPLPAVPFAAHQPVLFAHKFLPRNRHAARGAYRHGWKIRFARITGRERMGGQFHFDIAVLKR